MVTRTRPHILDLAWNHATNPCSLMLTGTRVYGQISRDTTTPYILMKESDSDYKSETFIVFFLVDTQLLSVVVLQCQPIRAQIWVGMSIISLSMLRSAI